MAFDVGQMKEKIKKQLEVDSTDSLTVTEMAERIDDLVNNVVTMETEVSSQTNFVKRLRSETIEVQKNVRRLQEDKEVLIKDSAKMKSKLKELEEEFCKIKILQQNVGQQNNNLQKHFIEARCNLEHLSERLHNVKQDEEVESLVLYKDQKGTHVGKLKKKFDEHSDQLSVVNLESKKTEEENEDDVVDLSYVTNEGIHNIWQHDKVDLSETASNVDIESHDAGNGEGEDQPNWRQMFINGLDDREKILLEEYTVVLRNYGDVRARLNEVEKKSKNSIFELSQQVGELKNSLDMKNREISLLRQKMGHQEVNPNETPLSTMTDYTYTTQERGKEHMRKRRSPSLSDSPCNTVSNSVLLSQYSIEIFIHSAAFAISSALNIFHQIYQKER